MVTVSFSLRRGGALVVALVVGVSCVLSACGRGDGGVSASAGSEASVVSASPVVDLPEEQAAAREAALAMAAPERPEGMDEESAEGAVATATYFV